MACNTYQKNLLQDRYHIWMKEQPTVKIHKYLIHHIIEIVIFGLWCYLRYIFLLKDRSKSLV